MKGKKEDSGKGAPEKKYRSVADEIVFGQLEGVDYEKLVDAIAKRAAKDTHAILKNPQSRARRIEGYLTQEEFDEVKERLGELFQKFSSTSDKKNSKRTRFYYTFGEIE